MAATVTFDYSVTHDGGKTWIPARKTFTGIRNPNVVMSTDGLHQMMFLAEQCEESTPDA